MGTTAMIGKLQPDNTVRFIRLNFDGYYSHAGRILQIFYSREHRVDALLNLGNLCGLGSSPFNPSTGDAHDINCRAFIRDFGHKPKDEAAMSGMSAEIFKTLESYVYLFMDGGWHVPVDGEYRDIREVSPLGITEQPVCGYSLHGLSVFKVGNPFGHKHNYLKEIPLHTFNGWDDIARKSEAERVPYFIFRGSRLVSAINRHFSIQSQIQ